MQQSVASQLLVPNLNALRGHVSAVRTAPSADDAFRSFIEAHMSTLNSMENIAVIVEELREHRHEHLSRKPLVESKCVSNLKVLRSDKSEFKNWNEKLINATSQTFGVVWRQFMKAPKPQIGPGPKGTE